MNYFKSLFVFLFLNFACSTINAQVITIDDQKMPQQLIEDVLINSSCAVGSNATGKGDTFRTGKQSFAYFNRNGSNFPFEEGIVLVTSTAQSAVGPFVSELTSSDSPNWLGDSDLDQAVGTQSVNATSLEFDFIASANSLSFNYLFASNEYQYGYPCLYSDGFAFLIKEAGTTAPYTNLAVIPKTNTTVSSVNIHPKIEAGRVPDGLPYAGCEASNPIYFNGFNTNSSPVNYAGQTIIMTAQSNVIAGKKYHVKLVIADDKNRNLESAIFLEAGSFASKIVLGEDRTIATNNPACFGEEIELNSNLDPSQYTFKWFKKDNPTVVLSTDPNYKVVNAGNYRIEATLVGGICMAYGEIKIDYATEILSTNTTLLQCDDDNDGISIFNLTKANNLVKNNVSAIVNEGYYVTLVDAQTKTNKIATSNNYTNTTNNQIVYARLENEYNCFKIAEVTLQIAPTSIVNPAPITTCDGDEVQDGLYQFDLQTEVTPIITTGLPSGLTANYYLTANDALTETNQLPKSYKNTTPYNQTIYARVVNGPDCYDVVPVQLVVNTFDPPNFEDESRYLCENNPLITLSVDPGFSSYLWSNGETGNSTNITVSGNYSVTVKDVNGCEKTKTFNIIPSEPAVITDAVIKDFSGNENSVLLEYNGTGDYEFSLDGETFQDNPLFTNVTSGTYNAVAKDKNGCGLSNRFLVYVLDYPRFFTPNGDGYNDLWVIKNADLLPNYMISIYDRYGKLLKQMNQNSMGWTGIFNGQPLPSDDYWFTLIFVDGKKVKGHFSLKR